MSDQVAEQSPQSRLEAMLGDSIQEEVKQQPTEEQPLEAEAEAEVPAEEAVAEEEVVDDAPDDQAEEEDKSLEEVKRGEQAAVILENPVYQEAIKKVKDNIVASMA